MITALLMTLMGSVSVSAQETERLEQFGLFSLNSAKLDDNAVTEERLHLVVDAITLDRTTTIGHHHTGVCRDKLGKLLDLTGTKDLLGGAVEHKVLHTAFCRHLVL